MHINVALALVSLFAAQEAVAVYCVPTLIALVRGLPNRGHIAVINMYLGWTVIGWVWALVTAIRTPRQAVEPSGRHKASGLTDAGLAERSTGER